MKTTALIILCMGFLTHISAQGWVDLKGGLDGTVTELEEYNGKLVVVGYFTHAGGVFSPNMAFWDGTSWIAAGIDSTSLFAQQMVVNNDTLFALNYGDMYFWDNTKWSYYLHLPAEPANSFSFHNKIYFSDYAQLVHLYETDNKAVSMIGEINAGAKVHDMINYQDQLIVTGCFDSINGIRYGHIASYDGTAWHQMSSGFTSLSNGIALGTFNNLLYVGGSLHTDEGTLEDYLLSFDGNSFQQVQSEPDYLVEKIESIPEKLFITTYHYIEKESIYTLSEWDDSGWNNLVELSTYPIIKKFNNKLYVAGSFSQINGTAFNNIVRWEETSGISSNNLTSNKPIHFFPNPANDFVSIGISSSNSINKAELTINDINGRFYLKQNLEKNNEKIYVGDLPSGIYIVKVSNDKEVFVGKLIKQ